MKIPSIEILLPRLREAAPSKVVRELYSVFVLAFFFFSGYLFHALAAGLAEVVFYFFSLVILIFVLLGLSKEASTNAKGPP